MEHQHKALPRFPRRGKYARASLMASILPAAGGLAASMLPGVSRPSATR